ncbi:hypothetical protein CY35_13G028100 [Sphagnum magellanicum]|nr:hypothetical protein CY35_13G028100 [Sphagnum magellanicum]
MEMEGGDVFLDSQDPCEFLLPAIEELYLKARLDNLVREALVVLAEIAAECRKQPEQRTQWEYLRGKVLDAGPDYCKEAEDHLAKSVQLDPSRVDAWCCLGNCFWKKGDLTQAKTASNMLLARSSSLTSSGSPDEAETVEESIRHAKQAVTLDIKYGWSWYTLGNAYFTSFFVMGAWDRSKLHQSLRAYQNVVKDEMASANPDLHFNSATVHQYLEDYERALQRFEAASIRDPGLHAQHEVSKLVNLLSRLEDLTVNKGRIKPKRLATILSCLPPDISVGAHKQVRVGALQEGFNKGVALPGKVLQAIPHENSVPLFYLVADREANCFALSVYALRDGAGGKTVTLLEPFFHNVCVSWQNKTYQYKAIRVDLPQQLLLNGQPTLVQDAVCSTLQAENIAP